MLVCCPPARPSEDDLPCRLIQDVPGGIDIHVKCPGRVFCFLKLIGKRSTPPHMNESIRVIKQ